MGIPAGDLAAVRPREDSIDAATGGRSLLAAAVDLGAGDIVGNRLQRVLVLEERVAGADRVGVGTAVGVARQRGSTSFAATTRGPVRDRQVVARSTVVSGGFSAATACRQGKHQEKRDPTYKPHWLTGLPPVETKTVFVSRYISIVSSEPSRPNPDCL